MASNPSPPPSVVEFDEWIRTLAFGIFAGLAFMLLLLSLTIPIGLYLEPAGPATSAILSAGIALLLLYLLFNLRWRKLAVDLGRKSIWFQDWSFSHPFSIQSRRIGLEKLVEIQTATAPGLPVRGGSPKWPALLFKFSDHSSINLSMSSEEDARKLAQRLGIKFRD